MWFERFVIVISSLANDFMPANWDYYSPSMIDIATYIGSFGLFFTGFLLFLRWVPMIAITEVKGILPQANPHYYANELSGNGQDTKSGSDGQG